VRGVGMSAVIVCNQLILSLSAEWCRDRLPLRYVTRLDSELNVLCIYAPDGWAFKFSPRGGYFTVPLALSRHDIDGVLRSWLRFSDLTMSKELVIYEE